MKKIKNTTVIALALLLTNNTLTIDLSEDLESEFFNSNSKLYYEIGGARRVAPPISNDSANLNIGLGGDAYIGHSCGEFDYGASYKNLMSGFKNNVDDAKNKLTSGVSAAVSSMPLAILQRAMPGVYDMYQEFSADANTQIEIATKSCEQMESEIAQGGNPYGDFIQIGKSQSWKDKAANGDDIVAAKKDIEESPTKDGIRSYGGEYVGGLKQKPFLAVASTVGAGFEFLQGSKDTSANTKPNEGSELYKNFKDKQAAIAFATDVIGEYEINNERPSTKVGLGLHPKVKQEREKVIEQISNQEWDKLRIDKKSLRKISSFTFGDQQILLSNIADDIATKRAIQKALAVRRMLVTGGQDPSSDNKLTADQRIKSVARLDSEIKSLMFERKINQELANTTISKILSLPTNNSVPKPVIKKSIFF